MHALSPTKFSEKSFDEFQHSACKSKDRDDIIIDVISVIHGEQKKQFYARTITFDPLMAGSPVASNPNLYYGARSDQLDRNIRDQLNKHIIPSTMEDKPMASNFFLEVKGPDGLAAAAQRQAIMTLLEREGCWVSNCMELTRSLITTVPIQSHRSITTACLGCTPPILPHQ